MSSTKKKIRPQLNLQRNTDGNAMLSALQEGNGTPETPAAATETPQSRSAAQPSTQVVERRVEAVFEGRVNSVDGLVPGRVYELPLSLLKRSDHNARVYYNPGEVEDMAQSLAEKGQDVPGVGYVSADSVIIVDGQKRFNACTLGKLPTLKVLIREAPASAAEEYESSRRINVARSTQTPFDDAVRWQELITNSVYATKEEMATRLGVSPSTVSKTLGLNRIPTSLRRMMAENQQTSTLAVAYEISNIFSDLNEGNAEKLELIAEEVIKTVIKKGLGREQTIELVRSKIQGPKSRVRGDTVPVKFGGHKGTIKVVPSRGEFSMSFRGLSESDTEELKRRVESILAGQMSM